MCGRVFIQKQLIERIEEQRPALFERLERTALERFQPNSNVCPTQYLLGVCPGPELQVLRWGWSRKFNDAIINAREDSLDKPIWAKALAEGRCYIPVSGYYEWAKSPLKKGKTRYAFTLPDGEPMYLAALWEVSNTYGPCVAIITVAATGEAALIHDRMPAILMPEQAERWIAPDLGSESARALCAPYEGAIECRATN